MGKKSCKCCGNQYIAEFCLYKNYTEFHVCVIVVLKLSVTVNAEAGLAPGVKYKQLLRSRYVMLRHEKKLSLDCLRIIYAMCTHNNFYSIVFI